MLKRINKRHLITTAQIILIGITVIITLYLRLSNPDLTETRLLLTFWREWIICVIMNVMALLLTYVDWNTN
jgi:uncharacterized membrane protein